MLAGFFFSSNKKLWTFLSKVSGDIFRLLLPHSKQAQMNVDLLWELRRTNSLGRKLSSIVQNNDIPKKVGFKFFKRKKKLCFKNFRFFFFLCCTSSKKWEGEEFSSEVSIKFEVFNNKTVGRWKLTSKNDPLWNPIGHNHRMSILHFIKSYQIIAEQKTEWKIDELKLGTHKKKITRKRWAFPLVKVPLCSEG